MTPQLSDEGAMMSKLTVAAVAITLALAGGSAFADDNSMSQWTGESYKAFEADRKASVASATSASRTFVATPDNGMSQFNGDSYAAFADTRTALDRTIARQHVAIGREVPPRATRG